MQWLSRYSVVLQPGQPHFKARTDKMLRYMLMAPDVCKIHRRFNVLEVLIRLVLLGVSKVREPSSTRNKTVMTCLWTILRSESQMVGNALNCSSGLVLTHPLIQKTYTPMNYTDSKTMRAWGCSFNSSFPIHLCWIIFCIKDKKKSLKYFLKKKRKTKGKEFQYLKFLSIYN